MRDVLMPLEVSVVLPTLLRIHTFLVPLILLAGGIALILGIILLVLRRGVADGDAPSPRIAWTTVAFRRFLIATGALGVVQGIIGGLVFLTGARPYAALHFVYGGIVLLAIPIAYVYSDQKRVRRDVIIMVIAVVAIIGAAIRALATGAPPAH